VTKRIKKMNKTLIKRNQTRPLRTPKMPTEGFCIVTGTRAGQLLGIGGTEPSPPPAASSAPPTAPPTVQCPLS